MYIGTKNFASKGEKLAFFERRKNYFAKSAIVQRENKRKTEKVKIQNALCQMNAGWITERKPAYTVCKKM